MLCRRSTSWPTQPLWPITSTRYPRLSCSGPSPVVWLVPFRPIVVPFSPFSCHVKPTTLISVFRRHENFQQNPRIKLTIQVTMFSSQTWPHLIFLLVYFFICEGSSVFKFCVFAMCNAITKSPSQGCYRARVLLHNHRPVRGGRGPKVSAHPDKWHTYSPWPF